MPFLCRFLLFCAIIYANEPIKIQEEIPIEENLKKEDTQRFIDEGLLDDSALDIYKNELDENEDLISNKPLLNLAQKASNSDLREDGTSLLENVYGHVGFFGKTNVLNKSVGGGYGVFSGSIGLNYDFKDIVFVDIGIYGMSPIAASNQNKTFLNPNIKHSNFIAHNAYVKYVAGDFFDITLGRFRNNRDWIRNYNQGMRLNANYEWFKIWLDWVDEQAFVGRENVSDYNIFKNAYSDEWLLAGGLGINLFGIDFLPYYYRLNNFFWAAGAKFGARIEFSDFWRSTTTLHYAFLRDRKLDSQSQIIWLDEALRYRNENISVTFGLGASKILGSYFKLADIGNFSRFETSNNQGYGIIAPGGIHNGLNFSNAFFPNALNIYGFIGFRYSDFSMMLLGRGTKSNDLGDFIAKTANNQILIQHEYSLGGRYRIIEGLYIGGVASFLLHNKQNRSFAKGYIEFAI